MVRWTKLTPGETVHFVCSADPIDLEKAIAAAEVQVRSQSDVVALVIGALRRAPRAIPITTCSSAPPSVFTLDLPPEQIEKSAVAMITSSRGRRPTCATR